MQIYILTLFPEMFQSPFNFSIVKRALTKQKLTLSLINIRDYAQDAYKTVDDRPYGGGSGMLLRVDVADRALTETNKLIFKNKPSKKSVHRALLDPQGIPYTQEKARKLASYEHLILFCGHYEGIDERVRTLVDEEISLGDFVLTGGEIPAMAIVDSVARLLPNVLEKKDATLHESFTLKSKNNRPVLEYPQYTRPETYKGLSVPSVLLSGDHQKINKWRQAQALERTKIRRPDLLKLAKTTKNLTQRD